MKLSLLATRTVGALLTLLTLAGGMSAQAQAPAAAPAPAADVQLRIEAGQHAGVVRRLALSPDERRLVTVGDDKTARVWSVPDQALQAVLRVPIGAGEAGRLYGAAFSPDGREIVVGGSLGGAPGGSRLYFFDAASGRALRSVAIAAGDVKRLVWLKSPEAIAACSASPAMLALVSRDGRPLLTERFEAPCYGLAAHPDGSLLAATFDGRVRRYAARDRASWQAAGGFVTEIRDPQSLAVSPDGRHVAVGYFSRLDARSVAVDVFELAAASLARRFTFNDLAVGNLMSVAWSRDGASIAAAGTGFNPPGFRMPMKRIAWPGGETREVISPAELLKGAEEQLSAADHVRQIALFTERNPNPEVAVFHLGPRSGRAAVSTRIRLATSQRLVALAKLNDGSVWQQSVDVIVTLSACVEGG